MQLCKNISKKELFTNEMHKYTGYQETIKSNNIS